MSSPLPEGGAGMLVLAWCVVWLVVQVYAALTAHEADPEIDRMWDENF